MSDPFPLNYPGLTSPCCRLAAVTPSDSSDLDTFPRGLWVGGQGDLKVTTLGGDVVVLANVIGILPIRVQRVWATGTNATGIVAMW